MLSLGSKRPGTRSTGLVWKLICIFAAALIAAPISLQSWHVSRVLRPFSAVTISEQDSMVVRCKDEKCSLDLAAACADFKDQSAVASIQETGASSHDAKPGRYRQMQIEVGTRAAGALQELAGAFDTEEMRNRDAGWQKEASPGALQSHVTCYQDSDLSETCTYDFICLDGAEEKLVLIDRARNGQTFGKGPGAATAWNPVTLEPLPLQLERDEMVESEQLLPFMAYMMGYWVDPSVLETAEWLDGDLWFMYYEGGAVFNIWQWAMSVLPLFQAQRRNSSSPVGLPNHTQRSGWSLPALDHLAVLYRLPLGSPDTWHSKMLDLSVVGGHTRLHLRDNLMGDYNASRLLCARRGAIADYKPGLFTSFADCLAFKQKAYADGQLPKGVFSQTRPPPRTITIIARPNNGRRGITNVDEIVEMCRRNRWSQRVVMFEEVTFEDQLRVLASTGVVVAAHGAALTNIIFLPLHAAVVEIFPHKWMTTIFRNICAACRLNYFQVSAQEFTPGMEKQFDEDVFERCEKAAAIDNDYDLPCVQLSKDRPVIAPIPQLEFAIREALETLPTR